MAQRAKTGQPRPRVNFPIRTASNPSKSFIFRRVNMKKVRSFIVGTAILTMATGAVVSSPSATFAQNETKDKGSFARKPATHHAFGAPLISIALKHRAELNLSNEQVANLEKVRTHYQDQTAPVQQQLRG